MNRGTPQILNILVTDNDLVSIFYTLQECHTDSKTCRLQKHVCSVVSTEKCFKHPYTL